MIVPNVSVLNFTPTSTGDVSPASGVAGVIVLPHSEQGQVTVTGTPAPATCVFPLSSVARTLIVVLGAPWTSHEYVHALVPLARCQVAPPSVETSTPATTPPPASVAVPLSVMRLPSAAVAGGEVSVAVGFVVSVEAEADTRPLCRVAGCAPMSANRLTVACCMFRSAGLSPGFQSSRPKAHCTVPAPNTSAPLGARYSVMLCVAVPSKRVVLP